MPLARLAGMICTKCSPLQVAQDAIFDARSICQREYASAPEVTVYGDPSFTFAYVPSHLHHMTFELVRALVSCGMACADRRVCAPVLMPLQLPHQRLRSWRMLLLGVHHRM